MRNRPRPASSSLLSAKTNWSHSNGLCGLLPGMKMSDLLPPSACSCSALRLERQTSSPMHRGCLHLTTPYSGEFRVHSAPRPSGIHVAHCWLDKRVHPQSARYQVAFGSLSPTCRDFTASSTHRTEHTPPLVPQVTNGGDRTVVPFLKYYFPTTMAHVLYLIITG